MALGVWIELVDVGLVVIEIVVVAPGEIEFGIGMFDIAEEVLMESVVATVVAIVVVDIVVGMVVGVVVGEGAGVGVGVTVVVVVGVVVFVAAAELDEDGKLLITMTETLE